MASNSFGTLFKITTFGESHGKAMGVVIDGCPANLSVKEAEINEALSLRAPGKSPYTSPRKEQDKAQILSGIFEGKTTGAPICLLIQNLDANSSSYETMKDLLRPGHANYTYLEKYGVFDHRGGGRASARETACRVAAGKIAEKLLEKHDIKVIAYLEQIGPIKACLKLEEIDSFSAKIYESPLFCPDPEKEKEFLAYLDHLKKEGDSAGGVVAFLATNLPAGLGDPVYEKLEAKLAYAMMSIPASKGFEIGSGFQSALLTGSLHNDLFYLAEEKVRTKTNHAGGTLGGISTGMPLLGKVAFKPTSSIKKTQETLTITKNKTSFCQPDSSRHDPCVAIRAVPVVEAMLKLVLADALLLNRVVKA